MGLWEFPLLPGMHVSGDRSRPTYYPREEEELRELLDLLENAFLTFSLARVIMVPTKGQYEQYPKETRS